MTIYQYPDPQQREIPINRFYETKEDQHKWSSRFEEQIKSILWQHTLSSKTLGLNAENDTQKIQVFHIHTHTENISDDILCRIDTILLHAPTILEIHYETSIQTIVAYKSNQEIIGKHNRGQWCMADSRQALPEHTSITDLYEKIISALLPEPITRDMPMKDKVELSQEIADLKCDIAKVKKKISKTQIHQQPDLIQAELRPLEKQLNDLLSSATHTESK